MHDLLRSIPATSPLLGAVPMNLLKVRDFAAAFETVGLPRHFPVLSYGLAEHTVGCAFFRPNVEGRDLGSISDEHLQACGGTISDVNRIPVLALGYEQFQIIYGSSRGEFLLLYLHSSTPEGIAPKT